MVGFLNNKDESVVTSATSDNVNNIANVDNVDNIVGCEVLHSFTLTCGVGVGVLVDVVVCNILNYGYDLIKIYTYQFYCYIEPVLFLIMNLTVFAISESTKL